MEDSGEASSEPAAERCLLLVDDEINVLSALTRLFRRDGFRILRAASGSEGLRLMTQQNVGVVLADQRMPGMNGTEFLRQVRDLYPQVSRIMLSGYTEVESLIDAINLAGIHQFLTKPWNDKLLRDAVMRGFERHERECSQDQFSYSLQLENKSLSRAQKDLQQQLDEGRQDLLNQLEQGDFSTRLLQSLPQIVLAFDNDWQVLLMSQGARHFCLPVAAGEPPQLSQVLPLAMYEYVAELIVSGKPFREEVDLDGDRYAVQFFPVEALRPGAALLITPLLDA